MIVYGIPNCNTVKKALAWLRQNGLPYEFHDYKKKGVTKEKLQEWCKHYGWENVLNKKGTTWQKLSDEEKTLVTNEKAAIQMMMDKPSIIKRPIIEADGNYLIRFDEEDYKKALLH